MPPGSPPVVLVIAGHDPTGGAGLQADIEAVAALGGRAVTLVTALTAQNTVEAREVLPQDPEALARQAELLLADVTAQSCKIGLLASTAVARVTAKILAARPGLPVVLDPVLVAGTGDPLSGAEMAGVIRRTLVPLATVMTPNQAELGQLVPELAATPVAAAAALVREGCPHVLITGGDGTGAEVVNTLYSAGGQSQALSWPRLPGRYHGSGCTLAAALACFLARGLDPRQASAEAQAYTWRCLDTAHSLGRAQRHPNRFHALPGAESP